MLTHLSVIDLAKSGNQTAVALIDRHEEVQMTPHTDGSTDLLAPPQTGDSKVGALRCRLWRTFGL